MAALLADFLGGPQRADTRCHRRRQNHAAVMGLDRSELAEASATAEANPTPAPALSHPAAGPTVTWPLRAACLSS